MIEPIELPKAGGKLKSLWKTVLRCAQVCNALTKLRIIPSYRNRFELTGENAVLEYIPGGGTAAKKVISPWQPVAAPSGGLSFMIAPGNVSDGYGFYVPSRKNIVIPVPANCITGYSYWLELNVDENGLILTCDYGHGQDVPLSTAPSSEDDDDSAPPTVYCLLGIVTSTATEVEIDAAAVQRNCPLNLVPVPVTIGGKTRHRMFFSPAVGTGGLV